MLSSKKKKERHPKSFPLYIESCRPPHKVTKHNSLAGTYTLKTAVKSLRAIFHKQVMVFLHLKNEKSTAFVFMKLS